MKDRIGEQLGNYRLLRLLGEGGQASVYLGEHIYLKSQAAVKVRHMVLTEEERTVFLQEAQTLVHLDPSAYRARPRFCAARWNAVSGHGVCSSWHAAAAPS
jgi:serine/threonine protein kinase